jgi:hypothetical protein
MSASSGAFGTRMSLPSRSTGVGHSPRRTSSYAHERPTPESLPIPVRFKEGKVSQVFGEEYPEWRGLTKQTDLSRTARRTS